jgi:hypothetical protein
VNPEELQALAVATAALVNAQLAAQLAPIKAEVSLAKQAAERASNHGIEANTRIDSVEKEVQALKERVSLLEAAE